MYINVYLNHNSATTWLNSKNALKIIYYKNDKKLIVRWIAVCETFIMNSATVWCTFRIIIVTLLNTIEIIIITVWLALFWCYWWYTWSGVLWNLSTVTPVYTWDWTIWIKLGSGFPMSINHSLDWSTFILVIKMRCKMVMLIFASFSIDTIGWITTTILLSQRIFKTFHTTKLQWPTKLNCPFFRSVTFWQGNRNISDPCPVWRKFSFPEITTGLSMEFNRIRLKEAIVMWPEVCIRFWN